MENNNNGGLPVTEPVINTDNSNNQQNITPPVAESTVTPVEQKSVENPAQQPTETKKPGGLLSTEDSTKNDWSEDWKQKIAKGDEKLLKTVDKFKTPEDLLTAYKELQSQYSKTRPIAELTKDATPEQVKEYREQVGIPESWEKYDTNLDGLTIGENDKPIVDDFLKKAHEKNLRPSEVKNALQAYFEVSNTRNAENIKQAEIHAKEVEKLLQKEWGSSYSSNISMITSHLTKELGAEEVEKLNSAVLADGIPLINNPKILNYLLKDAKANNMSHTLTPNTQQYSSLLDRKAEIERIQKEAPDAFYSNPVISEEYYRINQALKNRNS